jgi:hypothetical protein
VRHDQKHHGARGDERENESEQSSTREQDRFGTQVRLQSGSDHCFIAIAAVLLPEADRDYHGKKSKPRLDA